jgi:hypothetical protein
VERISRSPRAIQTIQAFEAAISIFGQSKPEPEYESQNMPPETDIAQHLVPIQNLLLYDVQNKHHQNKILGAKWRKWSDRIPNWHSKFQALMRPP